MNSGFLLCINSKPLDTTVEFFRHISVKFILIFVREVEVIVVTCIL